MIESYTIDVNPNCISELERYKLQGLMQVDCGKVCDLMLIAFKKIPKPKPKTRKLIVSISNISEAVADHFGISLKALQGKSRKHNIMKARMIYCVLAREKTKQSTSKIGALVNKDHATVLYHSKTFKKCIDNPIDNPDILNHYNQIKQRFD